MRAQDDTPNEAFNDMERYSRLVQFFSSPDKTLSELYPFSPYTSKLPLSECKIPDDALSLSSGDEDFSASDLGSPVSSGTESPIGRSNLYDEPPSRLFLKHRSTRKAQQSGREKEDALKRSEARQHDSRSGKGESRRGRAGREQERDGRPPSRRKESGRDSSSSSSTHGDSPDRGRSNRRAKGRARSDRGSQERSSQERSSSEGVRKRRQSPERSDATRQRHSPRRADATRSTPRAPQTVAEDATSPQKIHPQQRTKDVSRGKDQSCRHSANGMPAQNINETLCVTGTSCKMSHRTADPRRRCDDGKKEYNQNTYDTPPGSTNKGVSFTWTSDSTRRQTEETSFQCTAEPTDAHTEYNHGTRLRTWNITVPSSDTNSPTNVMQEPTAKNISRTLTGRSPRTHQQRRHTEEARQSTPDDPLGSFFFESTQTSVPLASWSPVGQSVSLPPQSFTKPSSAIPSAESPIEPIAVSPVGSSDASTFFSCTMSPFESQQSSAQSIQEYTFSTVTPFYYNRNKTSTHQECDKKLSPPQGIKTKTKTKGSLSDQTDKTRSSPTHVQEQASTSTHLKTKSEKPVETVKFSQEDEYPAYSFEKARSIATCTTPMNSQESLKIDDAKLQDISKNKPARSLKTSCFNQENVLISAAKCERKSPKSGKDVPTKEHIDISAPNRSLHRDLSWKSTSGSDVTEGDSLLDIEKFKQAVRSVEVPPEFLEPLEDSEDSDNVLNILETISESPLEDCSDVNNSSNNYADDEHVSAQSNESVNSAGSHGNRNRLGARSGSDLSDIQLHYAYGRNKNDHLELQWIKLEKIMDTASESSQSSVVDSPFNKQGESHDLQIRSMNLPNASTAPRHGDADRGPIATYLTLPTQSPATGEDPELAIVVLHEDNLSEHQKDVINRFRTGMKRRRSRSSSEMLPDVFGCLSPRENADQPLIIPISDPSTDIGTTGYAVIADSEPEVPLSVDVDVKSWFAKQRTRKEPPIVINQCPSKGLFGITPSYSESRLIGEYQKFETNAFGYDLKSPEYYIRKQLSGESDSTSSASHQKASSSLRSTTKSRSPKDFLSQERPKTAPPSSDMNKFRGLRDQTSGDKHTSQAKHKTRKRTPEKSPSPPRDSSRASPNRENSPKQTNISPRISKSPTSSKTAGNVQSKSIDRSSKGRASNKQDNTVKVLLEPKSKSAWGSKGELKTTPQNSNHSRPCDDKTKHTDSESVSGRHKRSSSASSRRTDKSSSSHKSNSPDRPKTASTVSDKNKSQTQRGVDPPKEPPAKPPDARAHKRSSSASEQPRGKDAEAPTKEKTTTQRAATAPSGGRKKPPHPACPLETKPATVETPPACNSSESVASSDSAGASAGGVPRYRLRRNIAYLSEYRKTIESLRAKCAMKDHMIDALLEELQRLAPAEEALRRLRARLSARNLDAPPRRDYSCCEVADLLPREPHEPQAQAQQAEDAADGQCVCPTDFRVAGKMGCDSLLLTWKAATAPGSESVTGYEVLVDGQLSQRVRSPTRTSALLMDLDLSREMSFSLRTLRAHGQPPCHPPLSILFAPSGDDWALDDPQPTPTEPL